MIDYRIQKIAADNLSEGGYNLFSFISNSVPNIWHRSTSSSGKYHLNKNNSPDTITQHVLSMLNVAIPFLGALPEIDRNPKIKDVLILAIISHDALKYGPNGSYEHTVSNHDYAMEEWIDCNRNKFLSFFTKEEFILFKMTVKYHAGRWGGRKEQKSKFLWDEYPFLCFFVHVLDILSSKHLIKDELYE